MNDRPPGPAGLGAATVEHEFGGKAAALAVAVRAGLPVPGGLALPWRLVDAVGGGDREAIEVVVAAAASMPGALAVRSSAVGEDSAAASFAGQHLSLLNVRAGGVVDAVRAVWRSGRDAAVRAYRHRLGLSAQVRIGVVIQQMIDADAAGVAFWPNPVTGDDELVIEASWGLGETVVAGLVAPDLFRLRRDGSVLERRRGTKDLAVRALAGGGTGTRPVGAERAHALSLDDRGLAALHGLALRCIEVFGGSQDLEWAAERDRLWLIQRRPVTGEQIPSGQ